MKRIFLAAASLVTLQAMAQELPAGKFVVNGDASKVKESISQVYLVYSADGQTQKDSSGLKDGKYSFSGELAEPTQAYLLFKRAPAADGSIRASNSRKDNTIIFLQPGNITIQNIDSFTNTKVSGSQAHTDFLKLSEMAKPFESRMEEVYKGFAEARQNNDKATMDKIMGTIDEIQEEMKEKVFATYAKENPQSPIALFALRNYAGYDIEASKVEPIFNQLSEAVRNSPSGKTFGEGLAVAKKTGIGQPAMDFTQNDTLDNPVSLASFKGKYVLVDFWASWCGPCRAENPNVVKAYQNYKDKGFTVLGVSLDRPDAKDKWLKAIHDDNLTWTHVSDLQFWNNAVAKQYGIRAIPQNLLIDPKGIIVGKNLRGEELNKKLAELFN